MQIKQNTDYQLPIHQLSHTSALARLISWRRLLYRLFRAADVLSVGAAIRGAISAGRFSTSG